MHDSKTQMLSILNTKDYKTMREIFKMFHNPDGFWKCIQDTSFWNICKELQKDRSKIANASLLLSANLK